MRRRSAATRSPSSATQKKRAAVAAASTAATAVGVVDAGAGFAQLALGTADTFAVVDALTSDAMSRGVARLVDAGVVDAAVLGARLPVGAAATIAAGANAHERSAVAALARLTHEAGVALDTLADVDADAFFAGGAVRAHDVVAGRYAFAAAAHAARLALHVGAGLFEAYTLDAHLTRSAAKFARAARRLAVAAHANLVSGAQVIAFVGLAVTVIVEAVAGFGARGLRRYAGEHAVLALHHAVAAHALAVGFARLAAAGALNAGDERHEIFEVVVAAAALIFPTKVEGVGVGAALPHQQMDEAVTVAVEGALREEQIAGLRSERAAERVGLRGQTSAFVVRQKEANFGDAAGNGQGLFGANRVVATEKDVQISERGRQRFAIGVALHLVPAKGVLVRGAARYDAERQLTQRAERLLADGSGVDRVDDGGRIGRVSAFCDFVVVDADAGVVGADGARLLRNGGAAGLHDDCRRNTGRQKASGEEYAA